MENMEISWTATYDIYNQCIFLVLTYGSETWHLTNEQEQKLRSTQRGMEGKMLGITWRQKASNMDTGTNKGWGYTYGNQKEEMVLGRPHYAQNGQQMDKESNGMATKKLQEKPGEGKNQVERRNSGIRWCKMELINIRQRKVEGVGKGLCSVVV